MWWIIAGCFLAVCVALASCKVPGDCSRTEEQRELERVMKSAEEKRSTDIP